MYTRCIRCIRKSHSFPPEHEHLEMARALRSNGYTCIGRPTMSTKKDSDSKDSQGHATFLGRSLLPVSSIHGLDERSSIPEQVGKSPGKFSMIGEKWVGNTVSYRVSHPTQRIKDPLLLTAGENNSACHCEVLSANYF